MNEFSISSLISVFRKCYVYVILAAIVFGSLAYSYCSFIATPTYEATSAFLATNGGLESNNDVAANSSKMQSTDIAASLGMLNTYVDVLGTTELYKQVAKETKCGYTANQIKSMVRVEVRSEESMFIDVTVTTPNPKHSVMIADAFVELGSKYVVEHLPRAYITPIERSNNRAVQNYPNTTLFTIIAAFLGAVAVFAIALIVSVMDKTIKGERDFAASYDIPILGNIPNFKAAAREERK